MKIEYIVTKLDDSKTLKDLLKNKLYISSILLKKLKDTRSILVNEETGYVKNPVRENDIITVNFDKVDSDKKNQANSFCNKFNLLNGDLDIIYEDEYLLVINKPSNMPIHPSSDNYENTLSNIVANYLYNQGLYGIHIVTRLDKNTTGLSIFAKNSYIQELFIRKNYLINLQKQYLCICDGIIQDNNFIIEKKIARKDNSIILREVNESGDYAKTECRVIKRVYEKNYSIVEVILHTGRTHQIRVHMASINHVLLGDDLYANEYEVADICKYIKRQALHCHKLSFYHPITNKYIQLIAKIPEDISNLL